jgi:small multidrug resistance pump
MPAWLYLVGAILSEVCGTVTLPFTDGLRRPGPTVLMLACYGLSIWLLALALKSLDLGLPTPSGPDRGPPWWPSSAWSPSANP